MDDTKLIFSSLKKYIRIKTAPDIANNLTTMLIKTMLKNPLPEIFNALKITRLPIITFARLITKPVETGRMYSVFLIMNDIARNKTNTEKPAVKIFRMNFL